MSDRHLLDEIEAFVEALNGSLTSGEALRPISEAQFPKLGKIVRKYNEVMGGLRFTVAKAEAIVDSAQDAIVTFADDDFRILSCNPAGDDIFGYRHGELIGQPIATVFQAFPEAADQPGLNRQFVHATLVEIAGQGVQEIKGWRADGSVIDLQISVMHTMADNEAFYTAMIRDISSHTFLEAELQRAKEQAEQAFVQLQTAQADLVRAEKMASLGGLVAGVAHEINTPVGIVVLTSSNLSEKVALIEQAVATGKVRKSDFDDFLATAKESCALLMNNSQKAAALIQSFKQVAVDQSSDGWRDFDLKHYIDETMASLAPKLRTSNHQLTINCPDGIEVKSYPGALAQVLTNFVLNSIAHAFEPGDGGTLSIDVAGPDGEGEICLTFADDGKGVPQEYLSRIFEPFFTTRRGQGGSGLGLHIVYNLVTGKLKGHLDVSSTPGKGTCFRMTFPQYVAPD